MAPINSSHPASPSPQFKVTCVTPWRRSASTASAAGNRRMSRCNWMYDFGTKPLYPFTMGVQCQVEKYMYSAFGGTSYGIGISASTAPGMFFIKLYMGGGSDHTGPRTSFGHASISKSAISIANVSSRYIRDGRHVSARRAPNPARMASVNATSAPKRAGDRRPRNGLSHRYIAGYERPFKPSDPSNDTASAAV